MRAHVLQHVPFEGLGSIGPWLQDRGAELRYTRFFADDPLPDLDTVDLLVAMGGPMSVNDEARLPWLKPEKQVVRDAIARDKPVLGVCLGAQLIASAVGSRVYRNASKEIGWYPVRCVGHREAVFPFPSECTVFHWHGETFDLPAGAVPLATSEACEIQAFQLKRNVIGLQFHPEMTAAGVRAIVEHCRGELLPDRYIQTAEEMLAVPPAHYRAANELMGDVLAYLTVAATTVHPRGPISV
jgi:GMP synthase-like glutamine amidotransferase